MPNTPVVYASEVKKIVAFSANPDGTLSPTPLSKSGASNAPIAQWSDVKKAWVFVANADGSLSPTVLS